MATGISPWPNIVKYPRLEISSKPLKVLVGERGFEPPTLCSQSRCATWLRHSPTAVFWWFLEKLSTAKKQQFGNKRDGWGTNCHHIATLNIAVHAVFADAATP